MCDLIDRQEALVAISKLPVKVDSLGYTWMIASDVLKELDDIQSVKPKERTAKVITIEKPIEGSGSTISLAACSECCNANVSVFDNYCSNCGAKLEWK